jgi:hypothetical protein
MDASKDNLSKERNVAKQVIESISLTRPWRFEDSPASSQRVDYAYLNKVAEADIFLLILGLEITGPVRMEYDAAINAEKPRLVFLKRTDDRSLELQSFIDNIDVKWKDFLNPTDLGDQIKSAISEELINAHRKQITDLTLRDIKKLEGLRLDSRIHQESPRTTSGVATSSQKGGINLGEGAQISGGNIVGRDQKITKIAGHNYYEAHGGAEMNIHQGSSVEDVLKLFDAMKAALEELDMPPHDRKKAQYFIDGAKIEAEEQNPNKKTIAERLREAAHVVKNTTNIAMEATSFGKLLIKGLSWVGKTVGWLAL